MDESIEKELEQIKLEKEYQMFFELLFKKVNSSLFNYDNKEVKAAVKAMHQTHRYIQQEIILFLCKFLEEYGKGSNNSMYEDARNEWALRWAKEKGTIEIERK